MTKLDTIELLIEFNAIDSAIKYLSDDNNIE